MMIAARNAFLMSGAKLPYDAEVEYLESTGTQYIDTGVIGGSATKVRIVAASPNSASIASLFGARQGSSNRPSFGIWQRTNTNVGPAIRFDFNSATTDSVVGANAWLANASNEVVKHGRYNLVNGAEVANNAAHSFSLSYPFFLLNINTNGVPTAYPFIGSLYACQIWDSGGVLIRDLIPVRVGSGSSAVGYLYDRANPTGGPIGNGLYPNAGTGSFILGPDK